MPPRAPWDANAGIGVMHNKMIAPLGKIGLAGAAWYQGESDVGLPGYADRLRELLAGWRRQFSPGMQVLVVQLPNYGPVAERPGPSGWAELREEQRRAVAADGNAALIPTLDVGQRDNLHPPDKLPVGLRLAARGAGPGDADAGRRGARGQFGPADLRGDRRRSPRVERRAARGRALRRDAGQLPLRAGERVGRQPADRRGRPAGDAGALCVGGEPGGQPVRRAPAARARLRDRDRPVKLAVGAWEAALRPEVGGALASLRLSGDDVLRAMPAAAANPLQAACFPLVPYANRIRDGHFAFGGRTVQLPLNFLPQRHSLHGIGWQRPWQAIELSQAEAVLLDEYDGMDAWPWAWRAEQRFSLDEAGLSLALSLTNRSDQAMPAGLGLHPYFRRRPETRVRFVATGVLEVDDQFMPTGEIAPADHFGAWSEGAPLPAELVDNCHLGWGGRVEIVDDLGRIAVTATGAPHLHVYAPPGGPELCFEPVSHTPDAINRALGEITVLAPGATARLRMRVEAVRA